MTLLISQQQTIAATPGDWSQSLPFNQFDPSIGTLQDAVFTTAGTVEASAAIENLAPVAATIDLGVAANINASVASMGGVASINPLAVASVNLPAFQGTFDGTVDFSASSAAILPNLSGAAAQTTVVNPGTQGGGTPLVGTGTFDVNVTSDPISTVKGNGNLAVLLHGSTGVTVSLGYEATQLTGGGSTDYGLIYDFAVNLAPSVPYFANDVTTAPQVVTLPSQISGWTSVAPFARFDPALGHLDEIIIQSSNTLTSTFAVESLENAAAGVSMTENASMTVTAPGAAAGLTTDASNLDRFTLGAFDGTMDLAGTSGRSEDVSGMNWYGGCFAGLTDPVDLAAFSGTGTIALGVTTTGNSVVTGPANLFTEMTQQTGGTVTVNYVYAPAPPIGGENSGGADTTLAPPVGAPFATTVTAASHAMIAPGMTFIGPFSGSGWVDARQGETFMIGPGASASIGGFSLAAGDCLNLTDVLAGAPLAHDLSNLGSFFNVTGQTSSASGGWNTTLTAQGPNGAASLVLEGTDQISMLDLLNGNALVLPTH